MRGSGSAARGMVFLRGKTGNRTGVPGLETGLSALIYVHS
jgi:hypothetical protein